MSLAKRWSICLPVLGFVFGSDLEGISVSIAADEMILIHLDGGPSAFGFGELAGESSVESAVRLLDDLDSEVPESGRGWGRSVLGCPQDGHSHFLVPKANEMARSVDLYCPSSLEVPIDRIDLGGVESA